MFLITVNTQVFPWFGVYLIVTEFSNVRVVDTKNISHRRSQDFSKGGGVTLCQSEGTPAPDCHVN